MTKPFDSFENVFFFVGIGYFIGGHVVAFLFLCFVVSFVLSSRKENHP